VTCPISIITQADIRGKCAMNTINDGFIVVMTGSLLFEHFRSYSYQWYTEACMICCLNCLPYL